MSPPECVNHAPRLAIWRCRKCQKPLCETCTIHELVQRQQFHFCPYCEARCRSIAAELEAERPPPTFVELIKDAVEFPATDVALLVAATVTFGVLGLLTRTPATGSIWAVVSFGIYAGLMMRVIAVSVDGATQMPDWPGISDLASDILLPAFHAIAAQALSFLPLLLVIFLVDPSGHQELMILGTTLVALTIYPIALIRIATTRQVLALNPIHLAQSVVVMGKDYGYLVLALCAVCLLMLGADWLPSPLPVVGLFLNEAIKLYCLAAAMRLMGLVYRRHSLNLNWFGEGDLNDRR